MREDRFLAGARIERSYGFGPLPGCATMITLISHRDQCCMAVNLDPAAVTDPELFAACMLRGFEEVLALSAGHTTLDEEDLTRARIGKDPGADASLVP